MSLAPLAVALLLLAFPAEAAAGWRAPVPGPVTRAFDIGGNPYEGGHHRGIDLAARPGTTVRAPCAGRVALAGRVGASGGVVTLLCGHWRVTNMPLSAITVRAGTTLTPGTNLGTLAPSHDHAGLHLGVRRDGTRFGYVDPLRFLSPAPTTPSPPLGRGPRPRLPASPEPKGRHENRGTRPAPARAPVSAPISAPTGSPVSAPVSAPADPRAFSPGSAPFSAPADSRAFFAGSAPFSAPAGSPVSAPVSAPADRRAASPAHAPLAPWPVWLGLALVLAGAGVRWRGGRGGGSGQLRLGREVVRRPG